MARSKVWNHFSSPYDTAQGKKVKCKVCQVELMYRNTTTNLRSHAEVKHKIDIPSLPPKGGKRKRSFSAGSPQAQESDSGDEDNPAAQPAAARNAHETNEESSAGNSASTSRTYQGPLERCVNNLQSFSAGAPRDAECINALLYMIATDNLPLNTPDKKGLRVFATTLQPLFKVPSETTTTRLLHEKYDVLKGRMKQWIREAQHLCVTCDLWTHQHTIAGYLGVTVHFRRGKEQLSVELCAHPMPERKTKENLKQVLTDICREWGMEFHKICAVVSDGGANIKGALKELFGAERHVTCFAHLLNGIGQKVIGNQCVLTSESEATPRQAAVGEVDEDDEADADFNEEEEEQESGSNPLRVVILSLKKIVRFFKKSEVATSKLQQMQESDQKKCLKLIQEVRTRFNSCYDMIKRYLTLAPLVSRVLMEMHRDRLSKVKPPPLLSPEDEDALSEIRDILDPLSRATKELCGEKIFGLSKVIPVLKNLKRDISKFQAGTPVGFNLKEHLLRLVTEKFGSVEDVRLYAAATLLDPRFKKVGFSSEERAPIRIANAISFVGGLVKAKMAEAADAAVEAQTTTARAATSQEDDFWGEFDLEVQTHAATMSNQDMAGGIPIQLRMYLDRPPVSRVDNPDPLRTWDVMGHEFKHVHPVAREYLSVLATSIPSERLFSHAGRIASAIISRLSSQHLNMLVFLGSCEKSMWF